MKTIRGTCVILTATSLVDGKPSPMKAFKKSLSVHGFRGRGLGIGREHSPASILAAFVQGLNLPVCQQFSGLLSSQWKPCSSSHVKKYTHVLVEKQILKVSYSEKSPTCILDFC